MQENYRNFKQIVNTFYNEEIDEIDHNEEIELKNKGTIKIEPKIIYDKYSSPVLVKGGHRINDANDLLYVGDNYHFLKGEKIENPNTHGTGCTLSSAIAANLAKGCNLTDSVQKAKEYISGVLGAMLDLGRGSGPLDHAFDLHSRFAGKA